MEDLFDAIVHVDDTIREDARKQGIEDGRKRAQYEARTAAREIGASAGACLMMCSIRCGREKTRGEEKASERYVCFWRNCVQRNETKEASWIDTGEK